MKIANLIFGAMALWAATVAHAEAQNQPSPAKEQPGPGSGTQQGTGSNPTQVQRPDPGGATPSTVDSPDNKNYGRETEPEGQQLDQSNPPPSRK